MGARRQGRGAGRSGGVGELMALDALFSVEDLRFRTEVRDFFAAEYPQGILAKTRSGQMLSREDYMRSQRALQARGWYAVGWPEEYGGPGWNPVQRYLFDEELERAKAPNVIPMGVLYVGPVIYTFGSDAQKRRWLPDILNSKSFWAQGYSEPEAGSDLTALSLNAERDGADYVVSGVKIWTSMAHWADWIFCLARTSRGARKDQGISFICIEMNAPGVSVHPIVSLDGSHHLNRVTFENVRVPAENLIGDEGEGWRHARFLLANERVSYAHVGRKRADIEAMRQAAPEIVAAGGVDASFMTRLARCEIDVATLETMVLRMLSVHEAPSVQRSASLKILVTETAQRISALQAELCGVAAFARPAPLANPFGGLCEFDAPNASSQAMASYLFERGQTIYGGATEIQKNIMARALLGGGRT